MPLEGSQSRITRYESLFELSSQINASAEISKVAEVMARGLKYVVDVFSWRYISLERGTIGAAHSDGNVMVIDGYQGAGTVASFCPDELSSVEKMYWERRKTCFLAGEQLDATRDALPRLFQRSDIVQLYFYPHFTNGEHKALAIFSKRRLPFSEIEIKFVTLAAQFFHEKVHTLWEQTRMRDLEQAYLQQEIMLRQSEKLATLGKLSAGVAHEINNPAAAAQRGAEQLQEAIVRLEQAQFRLGASGIPPEQLSLLASHIEMIRQRAKEPSVLDPLERSDREYDLESWLSERGVEDAWEIAPMLVDIGYDREKLSELEAGFSGEALPAVVALLANKYTADTLLVEIGQGAGRISDIVRVLKSYSYLDQAPVQSIDVREGLDDTLVMLRDKLRAGIQVRRDYAGDLPRIEAYGSELNQVWTNIIDNAVSAMDGVGELRLKAYRENGWVVVEIGDSGPGIPPSIQAKIFDPFFTTKPQGKGTGLGLNITHNIIVQKHKGTIAVRSKPGDTAFEIKLPVNFHAPQSAA